MLKMSKTVLYLISNIDVHLFVEVGIFLHL